MVALQTSDSTIQEVEAGGWEVELGGPGIEGHAVPTVSLLKIEKQNQNTKLKM